MSDELDMEQFSNVIVMTDDDGNEHKFEFIDLVEYQDESYAILLPAVEEGEEDDGGILILQIVDDDGEVETYQNVDDDAVLAAVFEIFRQRFQEVYEFEDDPS